MNAWTMSFGIAMLALVAGENVSAQPPAFRVDTDIYVGESKEPIKQTLTIFSEGVYYDFAMDTSAAITIVDPSRNRIVLINPERQAKTTISTSSLLTLVAQAREKASQQPKDSDLARMLAAADQSSFDADTQTLTVGGDALKYEAKLQTPKDREMAIQYAEFADWSARLNAIYPPHFLPFVRLELNRQIVSRGMLPQVITRTEKHDRKQVVVACRLLVNSRISTDDQSKLARVGQLLATCKDMTPEQYFAPQPNVAQQPTPGKNR